MKFYNQIGRDLRSLRIRGKGPGNLEAIILPKLFQLKSDKSISVGSMSMDWVGFLLLSHYFLIRKHALSHILSVGCDVGVRAVHSEVSSSVGGSGRRAAAGGWHEGPGRVSPATRR